MAVGEFDEVISMEKLYEHDPYLTHFTAQVESCVAVEGGYEVLLDQTAFYPEGGGQPWDTGTLGGVTVLAVRDRNGRVVHLCSAPLAVGEQVEGGIDWDRRFDLMQHHSGEHIVSGLAHAKWGCNNVGFHMGSDVITIDLDIVLTVDQLRWLEGEVNRYIWEDHPVQVLYPTGEELAQIDYRSKKAIDGQVRIVSFPGADTCACCGTHVSRSGEIGLVKLLSVQNFRDGVRIELLCGGRALAYLNATLDQNRQVQNLLSAKPFETASHVQRLLGETEELKLRLTGLENELFQTLAQQYTDQGDVLLFRPGLAPDALRRLCDAVSKSCGGRCACFSGQEGSGYKYAIAQPSGDLRELGKALNTQLNGRGGGKPAFLQGSVAACQADIESFFQSWPTPGEPS